MYEKNTYYSAKLYIVSSTIPDDQPFLEKNYDTKS